jgi:hypothetical protein
LARASFGTRGANIPAMLRAFVACGWFGIQTFIGGEAVSLEVLDHQLLLEDSTEPEDSDKYPDLTHAASDLECRFPTNATSASGPLRARFRHRTLDGHNYAPGIPWDPFYVLLVADSNRRSLGQEIVRLNAAVTIELPSAALSTSATAVSAPAPSPVTNHPPAKVEHPPAAPGFAAFGPFLRHGLHHVLTGYDHLLFLAALALASRRLLAAGVANLPPGRRARESLGANAPLALMRFRFSRPRARLARRPPPRGNDESDEATAANEEPKPRSDKNA